MSGYLFSRMQVVETLTDADESGRALPGLATQWQASADFREWRFRLRAGALFHDGTPVLAEHVASVLRRAAARPGVLSLAEMESVSAAGQDVLIRTRTRFAVLPSLLAHSSVQVLAPGAFDARDRVVRIIGSGPFRISQLEPPQRFEVERFPQWSGPVPAVSRAAYLSVGRAETRALMAEGGQAEMAFALDPASVQRLRRRPGLVVSAVTIARVAQIKVNAGHRWLRDARARRALSMALDRDGMARGLLKDPALSASQYFPPTLSQWHVSGLEPLRHDPVMARRLWQELGWRTGADGMLQSNGQRLRLTLRTFPDRPELPLLATAIQEQLRQTGIEVSVRIGNSGDIPLMHRDGTLELALVARSLSIAPDPIGTLLQDFAGNGGDWGAMNWADTSMAGALALLRSAGDEVEARQARETVARTLQMELPVIPVMWYRQNAAISRQLDGVSLDPLERSYRLTRCQWRAQARAQTGG